MVWEKFTVTKVALGKRKRQQVDATGLSFVGSWLFRFERFGAFGHVRMGNRRVFRRLGSERFGAFWTGGVREFPSISHSWGWNVGRRWGVSERFGLLVVQSLGVFRVSDVLATEIFGAFAWCGGWSL